MYSLRGSSPPAAQKIPNNFDKKSQKLQSEKKGRELDNTHTRRLYLAFSLFLRIGLSGTCFHSKITTYPIHVCVYSLIHMKLLRFRQAEQMNCFLVFFFFFLLSSSEVSLFAQSITSFIEKEIPSIVLLKKNARFLNVGNFERQKKNPFPAGNEWAAVRAAGFPTCNTSRVWRRDGFNLSRLILFIFRRDAFWV